MSTLCISCNSCCYITIKSLKFLFQNGTMLPSVAEIYLAPITDEDAWEEKLTCSN